MRMSEMTVNLASVSRLFAIAYSNLHSFDSILVTGYNLRIYLN